MKISALNSRNYNYNTGFRGNRRFVYDKSGNFLYRTTTYFFRDDLNWNAFTKFISNKYKNTDRVNIINHACSNGQESYSLAAKLIQTFGDKAEKFFPIIAKDIDKDNIESARRGRLGIKVDDLFRINHYMQDNVSEYFGKGRAENPDNDLVLIPKTQLKNSVIFSQSDIFDDIKTIPRENTIFMCRNFWQYLTLQKREILADALSKRLDSSCLIVTGDFDYPYADILLQKNGIEGTGIKNVYSKKDKRAGN